MKTNRKTIKMPVRYLMNAVLVALLFGIPLGYLAVRTTNRAAKALFQTIAIIGGAIPALWGGLLLILLFARGLGVFEVSRRRDSRVVGGPIRPAHCSVWCCRHSPWA